MAAAGAAPVVFVLVAEVAYRVAGAAGDADFFKRGIVIADYGQQVWTCAPPMRPVSDATVFAAKTTSGTVEMPAIIEQVNRDHLTSCRPACTSFWKG